MNHHLVSIQYSTLIDMRLTSSITIATYHVQGLTLQYYSDNGSVVVECRFAERSTADGCHVIFRESSKGTVKSLNMTKSSIDESTVYQYITLPVSGSYTVTAHDIVDGTIITNPSVVYPQVLEYILLLSSPVISTSRSLHTIYCCHISHYIGTISIEKTINDLTSTTDITSSVNIMSTLIPTSGISDGKVIFIIHFPELFIL